MAPTGKVVNLNTNTYQNSRHRYIPRTVQPRFPLETLPDELIQEVFSHLAQSDRLTVAILNKRCNRIATKLIYRRIYLNDSNVVRSDFMNIAINWTLLSIPPNISEPESRDIANLKLAQLIETLLKNNHAVKAVQWVRINWDLDPELQKTILSILCTNGTSLQRLENVTDPSCNDIIAYGAMSSKNVTSFDMAPPNSLPEAVVPDNYIPNFIKYLNQRISTNLSHMTLFIDPLKLFNYLYHLRERLTIVDLKLHWRREFYPPAYFTEQRVRYPKLRRLNEIFDVRTLKVLTIISWNEALADHEVEMMSEFKEFIYLEDLSLISIRQDTEVLVELFNNLVNLKRLKMDFLEDYIPETTNSQIFLSILLNCKNLQFIDIRFEGIDLPIINLVQNKFELIQKCFCGRCNYAFAEILRKKIFRFPEDYYLTDVHDIAAKDIYKMMRYLSLFPYSKACDCYPSVRTQPMNIDEFVRRMNENIFIYRQLRGQLLRRVGDTILYPSQEGRTTHRRRFSISDFANLGGTTSVDTSETTQPTGAPPVLRGNTNDDMMEDIGYENDNLLTASTHEGRLLRLPHKPLAREDIIVLYHAMIHHFRKTYYTFLRGFPHLRFLMLNDVPTAVVEEDGERIFHPIFYHSDFTSNLHGWSRHTNLNKDTRKVGSECENDTVAKRAAVI